MDNIERELGLMTGQLDGVHRELRRINDEMFGNGQSGAMDRLMRIEVSLENMTKVQDKNIDAITNLTNTVNDHINDRDKHSLRDMFLQKRVVAYFAGAFLLMSEITNNINIWGWIEGYIK